MTTHEKNTNEKQGEQAGYAPALYGTEVSNKWKYGAEIFKHAPLSQSVGQSTASSHPLTPTLNAFPAKKQAGGKHLQKIAPTGKFNGDCRNC